MRPYFSIIEDSAGLYNPDTLIVHPERFAAIQEFKSKKPGSVFWLFTCIKSTGAADAVISFKYLSYADLYIMPDTPGAAVTHHPAGAFRPAEQINPGDSRFHFHLKLANGITYRVLIRSLHTKQYQPVFDFELNDLYRFTKARQQRELVDFWFQGAAMLLLLYVLITWVINRYLPYLWLRYFA